MVLINQDPRGSRGKDRISELPEVLIHFILSFLPTQCAVSTSVLSKHWRYFWKSIPVIDLRKVKFPIEEADLQEQRVVNFVDRKLSFHHQAGDIKKIYFRTSNKFDPGWKKIVEWIFALFTRHNLEEFVLSGETFIVFLPSGGRYASLVILELDTGTCDEVHLPDAINFPNLKICRLTHANLYMYSEDPTTQFFSNLPVLEELELTDCHWDDISDQLIISAPALKYLFITGPGEGTAEDFNDGFRFPIYWFKISIFAPNLLSLRYIDLSADDFILHRFESLVDAEIGFERLDTDMPQPQENVPIATKVLKVLSNVKRLKISGETFEELLFPNDLLTSWPMFHNLVRLEVTSKISFSKDKTLLNFLRISPNLETIVFAKGLVAHESSTDSGWTTGVVPQCMLLHLKSIKFCEFYGRSEEINAVKIFLKNARVLQRMTIRFPRSLSTDKQNKLMKKLLKFPTGSAGCIIEF